ncbi:hypothetical protein BC830DRAFT_1152327, partial [Chytriomyces sp. MP71]
MSEQFPDPQVYPPKGSIPTADLPPEPRTRRAMLDHKYHDYWLAAEKFELNDMHRKKVWKTGPYVKGRKILRPKWVYTYKIDYGTNTVIRFKA